METKDQLITVIREWVKLDNEIRAIKKEEKIRKIAKDKLSIVLIETMKKNNLDEIDTNNGQLQYSKKTVKKPITKTVLLNLLSTYYEGDTEKASEVNNFILENREEVVKESIVRKINKDA
jgi:hypothetical protein